VVFVVGLWLLGGFVLIGLALYMMLLIYFDIKYHADNSQSYATYDFKKQSEPKDAHDHAGGLNCANTGQVRQAQEGKEIKL